MTGSEQLPWWKTANIYHIYPKSFKDSNGDGIGDLQGIISKLDYIKSLGMDAIWMCPMYKSPQHDGGYDVADYKNVHEPYGTVKDMEEYIEAAHARGIRVILDLVMNHTSDQHEWFKESRSSKNNPKRDWYVWKPARYDAAGNRRPPNNWGAAFGGSAWEWDEHTQEYFLHLFDVSQPDVNWENPTLREAIFEDAMHFWLRKGVDGFRIDVVNLYSKPQDFPDTQLAAADDFIFPVDHILSGPRIHEYLKELSAVRSQYGDKVAIGELALISDPSEVMKFVGASNKELDMVLQMDMVSIGVADFPNMLDIVPGENWKVPQMAKAAGNIQSVLQHGKADGWGTTLLENQDQSRMISRWGSDATEQDRVLSGKMLAMLTTSLSGTLILYQGGEIGMVNMPKEWSLDEYPDVNTINYYRDRVKPGDENTPAAKKIETALKHLARDHCRYPFSWNAEEHAGFSPAGSHKPWMRVHDNHKTINAENQVSDPDSIWSFWKRLIALRKGDLSDAMTHGKFVALQDEDPSIFVFEKIGIKNDAVVVLNMTGKEQAFDQSKFIDANARQAITNYTRPAAGQGFLRPWESVIWVKS